MSRNTAPFGDTNTTYDLETTVDQANGTVDFTGSDGSIDTLLVVSQDAGQTLTYGTDGGVFLAGVPGGATSVMTQTLTGGQQIAAHQDGDGNATPLQETLTDGFTDNGNGSFTFSGEGITSTIAWCDLVDDLPAAPTDGSVCPDDISIPVLLDDGSCALVGAETLATVSVPDRATDPGQTLDDTALQAACGAANNDATVRFIGNDSYGSDDAGTNPGSPRCTTDGGTVSYTPTNNTDCVVVLYFLYDRFAISQADSFNAFVDTGGSLGPFTQIFSTPWRFFPNNPSDTMIYTAAWAPVTGLGTTDVGIDLNTASNVNIHMMDVVEVCGVDNANPFVQSTFQIDPWNPNGPGTFDGQCHQWDVTVPAEPTGSLLTNHVVNHIEPSFAAVNGADNCIVQAIPTSVGPTTPLATELSALNQGINCNFGMGTDFISSAGTATLNAANGGGPLPVEFESCQYLRPIFDDIAVASVLELNEIAAGGGGQATIGTINLSATNAQCALPLSPSNLGVSGSLQAQLAVGSEMYVDLVVDGITVLTFPLDSTNGAINTGVDLSYIDPLHAQVAANATAGALVEVVLRCTSYTPDPANAVTLGSWLAGLTITP